MVLEILFRINDTISEHISPYIIDSFGLIFFKKYPFFIILGLFIIFGSLALYQDFIHDAWKIPFAMFGDCIDVAAMTFVGSFDIIAALYSGLIFFIFLFNNPMLRIVFTTVVVVEAVIGISFPFAFVGNLGYLTNFLPTCTIMMTLGALVD